MLHEVATRLRARTDELAELMTLEGGKPRVENADEIGWTAAAFDYYAEIGRDSAGRVIPPIESSQLALVVKEPVGPGRLHRPLELPAAAARLEAGAGARGGQRDRLQALGADPALDAGARGLLRSPAAPASSTSSPAPARSAPRSSPTSGSPASPSPARSRPASGSPPSAPSASRASTSRWAARTRSSSAPTSPSKIDVAARGGAWAAFLNAGQVCTSAERFYVLDDVYDDYLQAFADHTRTLVVGDPLDPATDVGPMVSARAAPEGRRPGRGRGRRRRRARRPAATTRGHERGHFFARRSSPAPPPRPRCCARRPSGPSRRSSACDSLDEAIELANSTRFGLGANVYTEDLKTMLRCMRELKAGTVWFNDPLTDNDAGPFGGFKQSGLGPRAGPRGARGLPGDQARSHRDRDRAEGLVVPVWTELEQTTQSGTARFATTSAAAGSRPRRPRRSRTATPPPGELTALVPLSGARRRRRRRSRGARGPAGLARGGAPEARPRGDGAARGALGAPARRSPGSSPRTWARRSTTPAARSCAGSSRPRPRAGSRTCSRARTSRASPAASTSSWCASRSAWSPRSPRSTSRR